MHLKEFIFDSPIYTRQPNDVVIEIDGVDEEYTLDHLITRFDEKVELFCVKCQTVRVFSPDSGYYRDAQYMSNPNYPHERIKNKPSMFKTFRCSQSEKHVSYYSFIIDEDEIVKVAEYPSKFDTVKDNFNKYRKIFDRNKVSELAKATQLESFGYAIAAFLYYRRIFEDIILQTFKNSSIEDKLSEEDYRSLRMEDKINYIKTHLPDYFNENAYMYGVLSKGVHELTEEECRQFLPVVKAVIMFALDELVDLRERELRKQQLAKSLGEVNKNLKRKN